MNICMVHNSYGKFSGEEAMLNRISELLRNHNHRVVHFGRESSKIPSMYFGQLRAFFNGIYSFGSRKQLKKIIQEYQPDIIQVQNLYPLISPSILVEAHKQNIPVVMRCANYRLICPNGLLMNKGQVCEKCCGGREWWCFLKNCSDGYLKSLGYALRNYVARKRKYFLNNVTVYYAQTEFQRWRIVQEAFPAERFFVIPNIADINEFKVSTKSGNYVAYIGRISHEKGLPILIEAADKCSSLPFKAAGSYARMQHLLMKAPKNFEFCGKMDRAQLQNFYSNSYIVVLPSIWYEGFPSVLLEAMLHKKAVICSRIGGLPEIVEDEVTGLLFEPGNPIDLAKKIQYLWDRPKLCRKMGEAGHAKAIHTYSPEKYYERLMTVYKKALELGPGGAFYS